MFGFADPIRSTRSRRQSPVRWVALALCALGGCSIGPSVSRTADNSAYQASCGGPFSTKLDCNIAATRVCPDGFNPISSPPGQLVFNCGPAKSDPTAKPVSPM